MQPGRDQLSVKAIFVCRKESGQPGPGSRRMAVVNTVHGVVEDGRPHHSRNREIVCGLVVMRVGAIVVGIETLPARNEHPMRAK